MVNFQRKQRYGWEDLLTIMHLLRAPEGCPWDREQTHQSIRRNFLEETYEALDAIDRNDIPGMCEELGDVLLQVVFHSVMEEEQGRFTADDVVDGVAQKLVFRHTHVFGAAEAADSAQALEGWEAQKKKEKGFTSPADAVEAVPHTLPAGNDIGDTTPFEVEIRIAYGGRRLRAEKRLINQWSGASIEMRVDSEAR